MRRIARICGTLVFVGVVVASHLEPMAAKGGDRLHARTPARAANEPGLRANVSPTVARAPASVRIQAVVEPNEDNRTLEFVMDSLVYYRSSLIELQGQDAARTHVAEFRSVPAGTHEVRVTVRDRTGKARASLHDRIIIVE